MSSTPVPVCEVLPMPSPLPRRLSSLHSVDEAPTMAKSLSLKSQGSNSSIQLLAKEASMGLEGDVSPVSKAIEKQSSVSLEDYVNPENKALEITLLPQKSVSDEMKMEDAAVVINSVPVVENSEPKNKDTENDGNPEEAMDASDEPMDTEDSGADSEMKKDDDAVASGSGVTDAPSAPAPYMGPAPIEIIICFDTTGSMSYYLDEVKAKVQDIIQRLFMDIPNMKIGVMAHGDYCDEKVFYLMQKVDFTNDVDNLCKFVKDVEGTGGGDFEECYEWVLSQVRKVDWTPGTQRSLIMIGDAIPHDTDYELNKENLDWRAEADGLYNEQGVRVYAVQCQNEKGAADFWKELANRTHGRHLKLDQFSSIVDILMAICYREHSAEYFEAYEKEVRSRVGPHIAPEMDSAFDVLRGGPKKKFDISTVDLSKGASKKKANVIRAAPAKRPATAKKNATAVVKKATEKPGPSTSAAVVRGVRRSAKNLDVVTKKATKAVTKARQAKVSKDQEQARSKISAKAPRETVPGTKFILSGMQWSEWKLAMTNDAPDEREIWQQRSRCRPGVRNIALFSRSSDKPAVYEFAVRHENSRKKYVVYSKATNGFSGLWNSALLGKDRCQDEIDSIISSGCELYVRRAVIKTGVEVSGKMLKTPRELSSVLRSKYDYAWRFARRSGSDEVSHRQIDIGAGVLVAKANIRKCTCVMCS